MAHNYISYNFKVSSAVQFKESLTEPANTLLYLYYGNHIPFADDNDPPDFEESIDNIHYKTYRNMIGGKQVTDSDVVHMVKRTDWANNTLYTMYSDTATHLDDENFFVVVEEGSSYNVFKCLDNNYGANSTQQPSLTETSANDTVYITTSDGYQWKYMYTIPTATWDKFATAGFIPVVANNDVVNNAIDGSIQVIKVTDGGNSYAGYAEGFVSEFGVAGDSKLISLNGAQETIVNISDTTGYVKEEVETKFVESLRILDGGAGFTTSDTLTISGPATLNATANITSVDANGAITGVNIITKGKSYTGTPTVTITGASNTAAANILASLGSSNGVIVDSNSTHLTISSVQGVFTTSDEIRGVTSNTYANIVSLTRTGDGLSSNTDFYKGSSFYIESGTGAGQLGIIDEYIVTANEKRVLLASAFSTNLASDSKWSIGPQVIITGDGSGAQARAKINSTLNANVVANVEIINVGSGYTYANVTIQGNTGFVTNAVSNSYVTNTAIASAVISPPGGHGSNTLTELFGNKIGVSVSIANTESGKLSTENDFREVGIIKDPLFANGTLTFSANTAAISSGLTVTGSNSNATATVVSVASNDIEVKNIRGFFLANDTISFTGGNATLSAVTQPTTTFRQTHKYTANVSYAGTLGNGLIEDEKVTQGESLASGYVLSTPGASDGSVELTDVRNVFLLSDVSGGDKYFTGANSAAQMKITSVSLPEIKSGSGEILYKENLSPVERANNQTETFKLVLTF